MLLGSRVLAVLVHRCAQIGDLQEIDGALPELVLDRDARDLRWQGLECRSAFFVPRDCAMTHSSAS
jgi:hypothetical protein